MSEEKTEYSVLLSFTSEITSAYISNNKVQKSEIGELIKTIYDSLKSLDTVHDDSAESPVPFVPVEESIKPDYLICLEDGKKLKMLKRYLKTAYNMTPQQYREKWNLPADYPMVAPSYAKKRSQLAKNMGLGKRGE